MGLKISKDESEKLIAARPSGEQLQLTATGRLRRCKANGWLIERAPNGFPEWLQLDWADTLWTTNANEALRFARQIDAQRYVERHVPDLVRITEHKWLQSNGPTKGDAP